jgi:anion-transporting  ArsA/GET3 family ATPase
VCIAELLSVEETKRLGAELRQQQISSSNIIVNQLVPEPPDTGKQGSSSAESDPNFWAVAFCNARRKIQNKYVKQLQQSFAEDMNIIGLPLLTKEVHGVDALMEFKEHLEHPIVFSQVTKKRKRT